MKQKPKVKHPRLTVLTVGVLNAIIAFYTEHERTPTTRELGKMVSLTAKPTHRHVLKLVALGILIPLNNEHIKYVINTELYFPLRRICFMKDRYRTQRGKSHATYSLDDLKIPLQLTYAYAKDYHMIRKPLSQRYQPTEYKKVINPNADISDIDLTEI